MTAVRTSTRKRYLLALMPVGAALTGAALWAATAGTGSAHDAAAAAPPHAHQHHSQHAGDIVFGPAPPVFPPGAEMAVLQGDPSDAGEIFTVRLRFPGGYVLPAHWHPTDEHVTVIKGTFLVGLGDAFDERALLPPLRRGDFITAPPHANHFAKARGRTIVQVHAIGPFQLTYVDPDDDPQHRP
jgi:quercetin dioxygenase-like cupin family protein